jgi:coenzyme F420-0:L-glutamate ligase/coenzyme F420-1:gamma-L-glutamate ligase
VFPQKNPTDHTNIPNYVMELTLTPLSGIPMIEPGDDLTAVMVMGLQDTGLKLEDGDIIVVAQKVVSKAEGRLVDLADVTPSYRALEVAKAAEKDPRIVELILQESRGILRTRPGLIIVEHKLGFVCANAGIDRSNIESGGGRELVLLLPEKPDKSANHLRIAIEKTAGKQVGILINDSHGRAWRIGTLGTAIGIAGVPAVIDQRGDADIFGYRLENTIIGVADELAAAASLVMGQAAEGRPFVHVRGFPYQLQNASLQEVIRPPDEDLFR